MTILSSIKEAYENTPEHDKELIKFAGTQVAGTIVFDLVRTAIIYKIGRKVCPDIFTSFGRTYAISYAVRLAVREATLTEDQKDRLKKLKAKQHEAKMDKYYSSEEFAKLLSRRMENAKHE